MTIQRATEIMEELASFNSEIEVQPILQKDEHRVDCVFIRADEFSRNETRTILNILGQNDFRMETDKGRVVFKVY